MYYPSLLDSFFAPTRVVVVSEERLRAAELEARQNQLDALDNRINELSKYRNSLASEIKASLPTKHGDLDSLESKVTGTGLPGAECDV